MLPCPNRQTMTTIVGLFILVTRCPPCASLYEVGSLVGGKRNNAPTFPTCKHILFHALFYFRYTAVKPIGYACHYNPGVPCAWRKGAT